MKKTKLLSMTLLACLHLWSCQPETSVRKVEKEVRDIDGDCCYVEDSISFPVDKKSEGVGKSRLAIVIDDSYSMLQEISWVRDALVNLSPLIKSSGVAVDIEIYKISDVDSKYDEKKLSNAGLKKFTFKVPDPVGTIEINKKTPVDSIQNEIKKIVGKVNATSGFGTEKGLCYVTRFVSELKKSPSNNDKLIAVVITDEDEHYGNSSSNCLEEAEGIDVDNFLTIRKPFSDNNGSANFVSLINDYLDTAQASKKKNFAFVGIIYDRDNNDCGVQEDGQHGENYLRLAKEMEQNKFDVSIGDVCSKSYTKMFKEKIVQKYILKIALKYLIFELNYRPVINGIALKNDNGDKIVISRDDYTISRSGNGYYVEFVEGYQNILKDYFEIEVFYNKKTD